MNKINVAMVGLGGRGIGNLETILKIGGINVTSVSDILQDRCEQAKDIVVKNGQKPPFMSTDFKEAIDRSDVDAVIICSSWESHIMNAIYAMKCHKSVGMEVGGAKTIDECWELVKTYEETKSPFMFMENCCFGKNELLVKNIVKDGLFGDIVHCHGAYAHDLRDEVITGKEKHHYRLNHYINENCENYPTHELGPIAKILNINHGNRMVSLVSMSSKSMGLKQYIRDKGDNLVNKDLLDVEFKQGDIVNTLIKCENGETISLKLDTTLPRSYSREFSVRGTKGMYEENTNSIFFDGDEEEFETVEHYKKVIDNATKYEEKYLPEYWKNVTKEMLDAGHGGMDFFSFTSFFDSVRNSKPMQIDVYDAASWMCISALSRESIENNCFVNIPDFTNGKWKIK